MNDATQGETTMHSNAYTAELGVAAIDAACEKVVERPVPAKEPVSAFVAGLKEVQTMFRMRREAASKGAKP